MIERKVLIVLLFANASDYSNTEDLHNYTGSNSVLVSDKICRSC